MIYQNTWSLILHIVFNLHLNIPCAKTTTRLDFKHAIAVLNDDIQLKCEFNVPKSEIENLVWTYNTAVLAYYMSYAQRMGVNNSDKYSSTMTWIGSTIETVLIIKNTHMHTDNCNYDGSSFLCTLYPVSGDNKEREFGITMLFSAPRTIIAQTRISCAEQTHIHEKACEACKNNNIVKKINKNLNLSCTLYSFNSSFTDIDWVIKWYKLTNGERKELKTNSFRRKKYKRSVCREQEYKIITLNHTLDKYDLYQNIKFRCEAVGSTPSGTKIVNVSDPITICPVGIENRNVVRIERKAGQLITLKCNIISKPDNELKAWRKDGKLLREKGKTLHRTASFETAGNYTCEVQYLETLKIFTIRVFVYHMPIVTITGDDNVRENVPYTMTCVVIAYPKVDEGAIKWYKDNQTTNTWGKYFTINSPTKENTGSYVCEAYNNIGKINSTAKRISTNFAPIIIFNDATVAEGEPFELTCDVDGQPIPDILPWTKDGDILPNTKGKSTYKRTNSGQQHSGVYKCKARNMHGTRESVAKVIIIGISYTAEPADARAELNHFFTMKCSIVKPKHFYDKVNMLWIKDNFVLFHNGKMTENAQAEQTYRDSYMINSAKYKKGTYDLSIRSVKFDHAGSYTCKVGGKERKATLHVMVSPQLNITIKPQHHIYEEHEKVELNCVSIGYPQATLTWFISGNMFDVSDDNITITKQTGKILTYKAKSRTSRLLIIRLNSTFDRAELRCLASLKKAFAKENPPSVSKRTSFLVEYKPIVVLPAETLVTEGKTLNILCRNTGNPPPVVQSWTKDGVSTDISAKELIVKDVKLSDAGIYRCFVKNSKGTSNSSTSVVVANRSKGLTTSTTRLLLAAGVPILLMLIGLGTFCFLKQRAKAVEETEPQSGMSENEPDRTESKRIRKKKRKNKIKENCQIDDGYEKIVKTPSDPDTAKARIAQSRLKKTSETEPTNRDFTKPDSNACENKVIANTKLNATSSSHIINDWDYDYAPGGAEASKAERTKKVTTEPPPKPPKKKKPKSRSSSKRKSKNKKSSKKKKKSSKYSSSSSSDNITEDFTEDNSDDITYFDEDDVY